MMKNFGDLKEGDVIEGAYGTPVVVQRAYNSHIPERMFEIESEDGETLQLSGNHLLYVELQNDKELHKNRVKTFKRIFSLPQEKISFLTAMAESLEPIDTTLNDFIKLMEATTPTEVNAIVRIAESVGHIMEDNYSYQDLSDPSVTVNGVVVRVYDGRRMAQQVLGLSSKKLAKKYPVIVGRVMKMEDIAELTVPFVLP